MEKFHRLFASFLGIGYIPKGGGTVAALVSCILWYIAWMAGGDRMNYIFPLVTVIILIVGVWSSKKMEERWGEDSPKIVIDEVAGMCLTLVFIPVKWPYILCGLALFRFFDIAKPLYIRRMESLKGGWGVMMDDVLAGVYANLVLECIVWINPWKV